MARKLGRGAANVLTAPLEVARIMQLTGEREGGMASLTVGVMQGFKAFAVREAVGLFEVVTFFTPFPNGFMPLVRPEFVYVDGAWQP